MPIDIELHDEVVRERDTPDLALDGTSRAELLAHGLHGECLLDDLQETVSLHFVQTVALCTLRDTIKHGSQEKPQSVQTKE